MALLVFRTTATWARLIATDLSVACGCFEPPTTRAFLLAGSACACRWMGAIPVGPFLPDDHRSSNSRSLRSTKSLRYLAQTRGSGPNDRSQYCGIAGLGGTTFAIHKSVSLRSRPGAPHQERKVRPTEPADHRRLGERQLLAHSQLSLFGGFFLAQYVGSPHPSERRIGGISRGDVWAAHGSRAHLTLRLSQTVR
jgi:hypothetical protein